MAKNDGTWHESTGERRYPFFGNDWEWNEMTSGIGREDCAGVCFLVL